VGHVLRAKDFFSSSLNPAASSEATGAPWVEIPSLSDPCKEMMLSGKIGVKTHIKYHKEYLTDTNINLGQVRIDKPLQISGHKGAAIGGFHVIQPPQIIF
jgi:hypothetical protein